MARRTTSAQPYKEPTPQQQAAYALEHAVEKAILAHPDTAKLRKKLAAEMRKAAQGGTTPRKPKKG